MSAVEAQDPARIEQLLEQLEKHAGPLTWPLVQELIQRTVAMYGDGLERVLGYAHEAAGERGAELVSRVLGDELLSSLLLLHGIHPLPAKLRVEQALEQARGVLGARASLELESFDGARATIRLSGSGAARTETIELVRAAISGAVPEVVDIDVRAEAAEHLVQIGGLARRTA